MNYYEQKQQEKKERYEARAKALQAKANQMHEAGMDALRAIPFGQPILVDHYSAKSDRAYRNRAISKIERSFEVSDKADYYADKADAVGTGGISSDDPDAIQKLTEKLSKLHEMQETMKRMNKEARAKGEEKPCPAYMLSNNTGNMRRIEQRIKELEAKQNMVAAEPVTGNGWVLKEDVEDNRICFVFDGKPDEATRTNLKRWGFKWSPTRGAWVRQFNNAGRYAAKMVCQQLQTVVI